MNHPCQGPSTHALVLGGGGAVGVGWQTGLLAGLRDAGADLAGAEAVVGTSAGALVGAFLCSGRQVTDALTSLAALGQHIDPEDLAAGDDAFLRTIQQARLETDAQQALRTIGEAAQQARTISERTYLGLFSMLDGTDWPTGFRCPAVDTESGEVVVWDGDSGVSLLHAVASSCAVPALFPPVTISGRRYMDGGLLSHLNAGAAPPTDVLVVVSCHSLASKGTGGGGALAASVTPNDELASIPDTTSLFAIEPDFGDLETPANMMDPNLVVEAHRIGKRQAADEAAAILTVWNS
jgi:NTE family protein